MQGGRPSNGAPYTSGPPYPSSSASRPYTPASSGPPPYAPTGPAAGRHQQYGPPPPVHAPPHAHSHYPGPPPPGAFANGPPPSPYPPHHYPPPPSSAGPSFASHSHSQSGGSPGFYGPPPHPGAPYTVSDRPLLQNTGRGGARKSYSQPPTPSYPTPVLQPVYSGPPPSVPPYGPPPPNPYPPQPLQHGGPPPYDPRLAYGPPPPLHDPNMPGEYRRRDEYADGRGAHDHRRPPPMGPPGYDGRDDRGGYRERDRDRRGDDYGHPTDRRYERPPSAASYDRPSSSKRPRLDDERDRDDRYDPRASYDRPRDVPSRPDSVNSRGSRRSGRSRSRSPDRRSNHSRSSDRDREYDDRRRPRRSGSHERGEIRAPIARHAPPTGPRNPSLSKFFPGDEDDDAPQRPRQPTSVLPRHPFLSPERSPPPPPRRDDMDVDEREDDRYMRGRDDRDRRYERDDRHGPRGHSPPRPSGGYGALPPRPPAAPPAGSRPLPPPGTVPGLPPSPHGWTNGDHRGPPMHHGQGQASPGMAGLPSRPAGMPGKPGGMSDPNLSRSMRPIMPPPPPPGFGGPVSPGMPSLDGQPVRELANGRAPSAALLAAAAANAAVIAAAQAAQAGPGTPSASETPTATAAPPTPTPAVATPAPVPIPPPAPPRPKTREVYERISQVGEGTYGKVYKARHIDTGRLVALKRIRMEAEKDGFPVTAVREVKLLQSLRHDNVVPLIEMLVSHGHVYMVLEYHQHDLTGALRSAQMSFTPAHVKSLIGQLLAGLGYIHARGVLHRDLKGSNVLLSANGELKLADFGLARVFARDRQADYSNRVVTLWYRSIELLYGATAYGPAVDLWAAGCIFLELFTTRPIFQGQDELDQLTAIYKLAGTPDLATWPDVTELPWYELVRPTEPAPCRLRGSFADKYLPSPGALDLAERLLALNPARRPTCDEALLLPYFTTEDPPAERPSLVGLYESHEWTQKKARAAAAAAQQQQQHHRGSATEANGKSSVGAT